MAFKKLKLWFDRDLAILLADKLMDIEPDFDKKEFVKAVDAGVQDLELKDRVKLISNLLFNNLGEDYCYGIRLLMKILGPENPKEIDMFKEYYWIMPIAKYVEDYGLEDFNISMHAIEAITKRNTGEYAIRPYIERYTSQCMRQLEKWSKDNNKHVRRLASEGGRPRLPWATKLQIFIDDPTPLIPILKNLKDDPSKYVQNSVANCINDIIKDNRAIAESLINSWIPDLTEERKWIIKHAIRNLRKSEDQWALNVMRQIS